MAEPTWRDSLPEELKAHPDLQSVTDVPSLAKQFVDRGAFLGSSIRIPSKEAGADGMKEFYNKVIEKVPSLMVKPDFNDPVAKDAFFTMFGRPKEDKEYELPEKVTFSDEILVPLRKTAHELGLNKDQFKGVLSTINALNTEAAKKAERAREENSAAIDREWGAKKEHNTKLVKAVAVATGAPDGLIAAIDKGEADPRTLNWLLGLAAKFPAETAQIVNQGDGSRIGMTPAEARARIVEIRANPKHPVWNEGDPLHNDAVQDWHKLHQFAGVAQ